MLRFEEIIRPNGFPFCLTSIPPNRQPCNPIFSNRKFSSDELKILQIPIVRLYTAAYIGGIRVDTSNCILGELKVSLEHYLNCLY